VGPKDEKPNRECTLRLQINGEGREMTECSRWAPAKEALGVEGGRFTTVVGRKKKRKKGAEKEHSRNSTLEGQDGRGKKRERIKR